MTIKTRFLCILIALDVFIFALMTLGASKRNETISAAAWSLEQDGKWQGRLFRPLIDGLFYFIEHDHCAVSWLIEHKLSMGAK